MSVQAVERLKATSEYSSDSRYKTIVDHVDFTLKVYGDDKNKPACRDLYNVVTINVLTSPQEERKAWKDCFQALMNRE